LIDTDVPFAAEPFLEMLRARWRESVKPVVPTMFMPIDRLTPEEARALPGVVRAYRSAVAECERRPDLGVACWLVEVEMFAAVELYMVGNAGQCTAGRVVVTAAG